jgi:hypothetical protein
LKRARDVQAADIQRAERFLARPLGDMFKAPMPLKSHDLVTMKLSELAHLMAFYFDVRLAEMFDGEESFPPSRALQPGIEHKRLQP